MMNYHECVQEMQNASSTTKCSYTSHTSTVINMGGCAVPTVVLFILSIVSVLSPRQLLNNDSERRCSQVIQVNFFRCMYVYACMSVCMCV